MAQFNKSEFAPKKKKDNRWLLAALLIIILLLLLATVVPLDKIPGLRKALVGMGYDDIENRDVTLVSVLTGASNLNMSSLGRAPGGPGEAADHLRRARAHVHAPPDRLSVIVGPDCHQGQHRGFDAGVPEFERLSYVDDAKPGRAARQGGAGRRNRAVPVPARLHHGHHGRGRHPAGERGGVLTDRVQVDGGFGVADHENQW